MQPLSIREVRNWYFQYGKACLMEDANDLPQKKYPIAYGSLPYLSLERKERRNSGRKPKNGTEKRKNGVRFTSYILRNQNRGQSGLL